MRLPMLLALLAALPVKAHVGSPDIFLEGTAGPYRLWVTVRPPAVIPGVASIEVRSESRGVTKLEATPVPLTEKDLRLAPSAEALKSFSESPDFFTGSIWLMRPGSWQLRLHASGSRGEGTMGVPVPAMALQMKGMQRGLGIALSTLMGLLVFGLIAIAGASAGEATLPPGSAADGRTRRKSMLSMLMTAVFMLAILGGGHRWWKQSETEYSNNLYKPLQMEVFNQAGVLNLHLVDPGWLPIRKVDDLTLDHGHLMHFYAIRQPGMDAVFHLHPQKTGAGKFRLPLPAMPPGAYRLYADIVHEDGFPETLTALFNISAEDTSHRAFDEDDAGGLTAPFQPNAPLANIFHLPDGSSMTWLNVKGALRARDLNVFRFRLLGPKGETPKDMQLYMGMLGHAAFVKTDFTTFAHVHPDGSANMAALMMTQTGMSEMAMDSEAIPNEVSFPYGFPKPGRYRIFVQMRKGNTVETGVFDASVR